MMVSNTYMNRRFWKGITLLAAALGAPQGGTCLVLKTPGAKGILESRLLK
jgi:hypothetical protein